MHNPAVTPIMQTHMTPRPRQYLPATIKTVPIDPAVEAGKNCLQKQADLLAATRNERLTKMHTEISGWVRHHKLTSMEANTIEQYLNAHPDGDIAPTNGLVTWAVQLARGLVHLSYRQVCVCHEWVTLKLPPPPPAPVLPPRPIPPRHVEIPLSPASVSHCIEYDYTVEVGDQVRYAAITRGRMPAECWKLCDGDECSAPPSPCTVCDWLRPLSVIPGGREPNYTGVYVALHRKQRFFAPVDMIYEYFVVCVDRNGRDGDSDSWIARPEEWGGHLPYTTPLNRLYLIPAEQWPVWGVYDRTH